MVLPTASVYVPEPTLIVVKPLFAGVKVAVYAEPDPGFANEESVPLVTTISFSVNSRIFSLGLVSNVKIKLASFVVVPEVTLIESSIDFTAEIVITAAEVPSCVHTNSVTKALVLPPILVYEPTPTLILHSPSPSTSTMATYCEELFAPNAEIEPLVTVISSCVKLVIAADTVKVTFTLVSFVVSPDVIPATAITIFSS